ncbi:MAG: thioredoxin family protein, partial [Deltaproteobacteria bacterium]|nr:thioredoxin family protein [Deltaproteobacteria bacterium]
GLVNAASKGFGGFFGSFFMGLTLGVVAAPCLGPFVLGLLTYVGQKGDPLLGFLYFFVLSIGLGLPLALLAVCSGIVDKLPMSGNWLLWVKKCFGWILIGMAVFMIRPLIPGATWKILAIPVVLVAAGLHIAFLDKTKVGSVRFGIVKTLAGLGLFVVAFALASMVWRAEEGIKWLPYRQGLLQQAKAEKKPVIIDFYAEWCGPCREMDRITFRDARVKGFAKNFVTLRVDLTRERPETKELVKQFNIRGVPSVIFIDRGGNEVRSIRVESYEPPETFAIKMADILKK